MKQQYNKLAFYRGVEAKKDFNKEASNVKF